MGPTDAHNRVSGLVMDGALAVHRTLGPGLLESVYEQCLAIELRERGLTVERQVSLPLDYKGHMFDGALRLDLLVADRVIVEMKAVERFLPIHEAQLQTYLKLSDRRLGLLINFNVIMLRDGVRRLVNKL